MSKNNRRLLTILDVLTDGVIVLFSYWFSAWLWLDAIKNFNGNMAVIRSWRDGIGIAAILYSIAMLLVLALFGLYNKPRFRRMRHETLAILEANALGILGIATLLFLLKLQDFSRGVLVVFYITNSLVLYGKRALIRAVFVRLRDGGHFVKHVIIVGTASLARQYAKNIAREDQFEYTVAGFIGSRQPDLDNQYLGDFDQLDCHLQNVEIDEVVIALEPEEIGWIKPVISTCEKCGTKVSVIPFYNDIIPPNPAIEIVGDTMLINLRSNPLDNLGYAFIKRLFDIVAGSVLIVILAVPFLLIGFGIKLSSPGPIFFRQQRVGRNKRWFQMYKFRSMRVNADQDTAWTTNDDPRKTRFGSFLRKYSIDELPQLFNVVKGDMSLIGPRPEIPYYVEQFKEGIPLYMVKHQVRPGMTGWAQVNGYRGDTSISKRIEYDIWYIEHWSIALDLKILLRTLIGGWINHETIVKTK